jgi:tetratricopeptide (TPR) repeat protein
VARLASHSDRKRETAFVALRDKPTEKVVPLVAQLLIDDSTSSTQVVCLDLLERAGAVTYFRDSRSDGWFEKLGESIVNFDLLCEIIGGRFLAYAMILGIQIRSLARDPRVPANNTVEFTGEDNLLQVLTIGEFRSRLVQALLLKEHEIPSNVDIPLDEETAISVIGPDMVLLTSLFELSMRQFIWVDDEENGAWAIVGFISEAGFNFMELGSFESMVKQKLHRDLVGTFEEPFQLDLSAIEQAREAEKEGSPEKVIHSLETWPGLLAALHRTPVAKQLNNEQLDLIAEGLVLLGDAFKAKNRFTWSEELYRLGLQFIREGSNAARLYSRLGILLSEVDRHGEAIGFLRRASALDADNNDLLVPLGRSFLRRDKLVPAALLLLKAREQGIESEQMEEDLGELLTRFEEAGLSWPSISKKGTR